MAATIDVVVRNVTDLEEVTVTVAESATLLDLKEALAEIAERPELMEVGEILRILADGSTAPIKETVKVGIRRLMGFRGCPLHPPLPERPPLSLEDFAEFDPDEDELTSPRSVKACWLEGVAPEDLIYVPLESYTTKRIEPRIAQLWYDFFEAIRQDSLKAVRGVWQSLIAEEEGKSPVALIARPDDTRIAGTGGNWCGALEHSRYENVAEFFIQRNQMMHIDRVYRGATKPYRPNLKGSRYSSNTPTFHDEDPVLAGDNADDAADKLYDMMRYYHHLPNAKKFVEEQRLKTKATGIVQFGRDAQKLHKDQKEYRRLMDSRIETSEAQIAMLDYDIQERMQERRDMDQRNLESKPPKNKLEEIRLAAIKERSEQFASRRGQIHEDQLDNEYKRCDEMQRLNLHDQAVEERVHQHRSLRKIAFAREWVKRRVRFQLNHNSISENRDSWNEATLQKQQAAADRVETQHLIRQKWIEYRREMKSLKRLYADLAAKREKGRQDARREMVASEFSRKAIEEAGPSPSPMRRSRNLSASLGSTAFSSQSLGAGSSLEDYNMTAPLCHLLKQPRVVKRIARFDFPRMGSGMLSSSPTASTRSGTLSQPSTMRQSMSVPSFTATGGPAEERELRRAIAYS